MVELKLNKVLFLSPLSLSPQFQLYCAYSIRY